MKRGMWILIGVLVMISFVVGGYATSTLQKPVSGLSCTSTTGRVSVSGVAYREVTPDRAVLSVNIVGESKDADVAMEILKKNASYVMDIASKYTESKHIKTTGLSLRQVGHFENNTYVYDKFVASETVMIDVEVEKVGELAGKLTDMRAEHVRLSGISFYYSKVDEVRKQLLEEAILDAKNNAEHLVAPLGAEFLSLVSVTYGNATPMPVYRLYEKSAVASSESNPIPVSAGSQKISVTVSAVFETGPVCITIEK